MIRNKLNLFPLNALYRNKRLVFIVHFNLHQSQYINEFLPTSGFLSLDFTWDGTCARGLHELDLKCLCQGSWIFQGRSPVATVEEGLSPTLCPVSYVRNTTETQSAVSWVSYQSKYVFIYTIKLAMNKQNKHTSFVHWLQNYVPEFVSIQRN